MDSPGPDELGRGLVVGPGGLVPEPWSRCPRIVVGDAEVAEPGPSVAQLHHLWFERQRVVVELAADAPALRAPERWTGPVYQLTPDFEFSRERLQFLVWANNYDARHGGPVWWHGRKAVRRSSEPGGPGPKVGDNGPADLRLADDTPLFVDGGPTEPPRLACGIGVVHRWNAEAGILRPNGHRDPTSELALDQLGAVGHRVGAARVIAPAGSGKTRVLTERLRHLIADRGVHPSIVSALAFNVKAAGELKQRCAELQTSSGPHIRTLNSLGLWICSQFGPTARPRLLGEPEVRDLLQSLIEIRRQSNTDTVAPYLEALSAIRLGLTSPRVVEEANSDAAGVADAFDRYRRALAERGAVDFDEQIYLAIEILLTDPDARAAAQTRCRHLLVDEFQDLNPAHLLLIRLLAAPGYNCFGVGDDDQVIYGYSGATPEFLINFSRHFPGASHHDLTVNYRCPPAVVSATKNLLSYNARRVEKEIGTAPGRTDDVADFGGPLAGAGPVVALAAPAEQLTGLALDVIAAWRDAGVAADDIAVLSRVNSTLLPVQVACIEAGVPCTMPLTNNVLQRTGIRTAFAYLRIGADPGRIRREDIVETIRRPSRGIAPKVADMITERRTTSVKDIRRLAHRLSGRDVSKVEAYSSDLDTVVKASAKSTAAALKAIRVRIGLGDTMDVLDSSRNEADRSTHADDLLALESVAALHPEAETFEHWLRATLVRTGDGGPAVLLSTVHKIKGREWGHVIIYGASHGLFPHRLSDDEEGERRVFHVALTRARSQVVTLADAESPSVFVAELGTSRQRLPAGSRTGHGASSPVQDQRRPGGGTRGTRDKSGAGRHQVALPMVAASIGLVLVDRGTTGTVVEVTLSAAVLSVGAVRISVPLGSEVQVDGRSVTLVAPGQGEAVDSRGRSAVPSGESGPVEQALRAWRSEVASKEKVPAYVILKDTELAGIVARLPSTLAELARCRGMGPIRLERWGDEIMAVLDASRAR